MNKDNSILEYFVGTESSIREGLAQTISRLSDLQWSLLNSNSIEYHLRHADEVLDYLHSKGLKSPNGDSLVGYRAGW